MVGLPALAGALFGVALYLGLVPWLYVATVLGLGLLAAFTGRVVAGKYPVAAALLITASIVLNVVVMAAATAALLWTGLWVPQLLPVSNPETHKQAVAAVAGALSTFVGVLVTKDIESGKGQLWPGAQFRKAIETAFASENRAPKGDTKAWDAVYQDRVRDNGPIGWGLRARLQRAWILRDHLRSAGSRT